MPTQNVQDNEKITILSQLQEYCECMKESNVTDKNVFELVNLISSYTCWMQKPCETFLTAERREVVDLPDCVCDCDVFTFEPFYTPFDVSSFTFTLVEQNGIQETATDISSYFYSEIDENFKLELPLEDCRCRPSCGCKSNYKLLVTYTAGYDLLPECLLPIFCEALCYIAEKNRCCAECEPCEGNDTAGEIDYTSMDGYLQEYFITVLSAQYRNQLSLISLCEHKHKLWAVVV